MVFIKWVETHFYSNKREINIVLIILSVFVVLNFFKPLRHKGKFYGRYRKFNLVHIILCAFVVRIFFTTKTQGKNSI